MSSRDLEDGRRGHEAEAGRSAIEIDGATRPDERADARSGRSSCTSSSCSRTMLEVVAASEVEHVVAAPAELDRLSFDRLTRHVLGTRRAMPAGGRGPEDVAWLSMSGCIASIAVRVADVDAPAGRRVALCSVGSAAPAVALVLDVVVDQERVVDRARGSPPSPRRRSADRRRLRWSRGTDRP